MLVRDIVNIIHRAAPPDLALDWDNCGLQAGSVNREVRKIGLALDATEATVAQALAEGCDLLLTHHPLLFKPIRSLDIDREPGSLINTALNGGLTIFAAHTNWDSAAKGVAATLGGLLELENRRPLEPAARDFLKLVVFVPAGYEGVMRRALFEAGAGGIGDYDHCWFGASGQGGFRSPDNGKPFLGCIGEDTRARESRLEVILPKYLADRAAEAVLKSHPYEEPAFEFHPVKIYGQGQGAGLLGEWNPPRNVFNELRKIGPAFKWTGPEPGLVTKVALLPGSGGGYLGLAHRQGAEVLICGDAGYHQALEAQSLGLTLVDIGHFETEWPGVMRLAGLLESELQRLKAGVECKVLNQLPAWHYHCFEDIEE